MKKLTILAAVMGIFAMVAVANAQPFGIGVSFDEGGTQFTTSSPIPTGSEFHVYVVGYFLTEIFGYEFELHPKDSSGFMVGKDVYGSAPQDFGSNYEVRAGTGACMNNAATMGPNANTWTLTRYKILYFADPGTDYDFCIGPSPGSGATLPQGTFCDANATIYQMSPATQDQSGIVGDGCAVANATQGQNIVDAETSSWGSLKAAY